MITPRSALALLASSLLTACVTGLTASSPHEDGAASSVGAAQVEAWPEDPSWFMARWRPRGVVIEYRSVDSDKQDSYGGWQPQGEPSAEVAPLQVEASVLSSEHVVVQVIPEGNPSENFAVLLDLRRIDDRWRVHGLGMFNSKLRLVPQLVAEAGFSSFQVVRGVVAVGSMDDRKNDGVRIDFDLFTESGARVGQAMARTCVILASAACSESALIDFYLRDVAAYEQLRRDADEHALGVDNDGDRRACSPEPARSRSPVRLCTPAVLTRNDVPPPQARVPEDSGEPVAYANDVTGRVDPSRIETRAFEVPTRLVGRYTALCGSEGVADGFESVALPVPVHAATAFRLSLYRWPPNEPKDSNKPPVSKDRSREPDNVLICTGSRAEFRAADHPLFLGYDVHLEVIASDVPLHDPWDPESGTCFSVLWDRWFVR